MNAETDSQQLIADFFQAFARRDFDAVENFFTDDVVYTVVGDPKGDPPLDPETKAAIPWIGRYRGPKGAREFIAHLLRNIEVVGFGPQEVIANNDRVAVFGTFSYRAVSTGKRFDSEYAIRIHLRDGRISQYSFYENTYAVAAAFRTSGGWHLHTDTGERQVPSDA